MMNATIIAANSAIVFTSVMIICCTIASNMNYCCWFTAVTSVTGEVYYRLDGVTQISINENIQDISLAVNAIYYVIS